MFSASPFAARFPRCPAPALRVAVAVRLLGAFFAAGASGFSKPPPVAAELGTFSSALPVLVLDNHGGGEVPNDLSYHDASLDVFLPGANGLTTLAGAPAFSSSAQVRVRGNSSASFPKKSYNLGLEDSSGHDNPQALLGLDASADWALVAPWNYDRTFIRNAYVYRLSRAIGRWAPRTRFAELFFNWNGGALDSADYLGLTVLTDRLKFSPDRLDLASLSPSDTTAPAITGGYLIKIDVPAPDDFAFTTDHGIPNYDGCYVIVNTPDSDKLTSAQGDYIHGYVQTMENTLFADRDSGWTTRNYLNYLDRASWVDHHLLETFVGNIDAFAHSDYFFKDRGGKLAAGPAWDFDRALGAYDPRAAAPDRWSVGPVGVWDYGWYGVLGGDPEFQQAWVDRWQALRRTEFSTANLLALADSLAAEVTPEAAARDASRWPDNVSPTGSFAGEITRIKDWLARRANWIDQQFVAPPTLTTDGSTLVVTPPAGAQLAYTLNGVDPRGPNGQLGLNAQLISAPLVVGADTQLIVRAWNPAANTFPGSPWSGPLTRDDARRVTAGLTSDSRLANLSSLVHVGPGEGAPLTGVVVTGSAEKYLLVRSVGPGLRQFGMSDALPDPVLRILDRSGREIFRNAGWSSGPDAAQLPRVAAEIGAFPLSAGSADAALLVHLAPGTYTLLVESAASQAGAVLTEIYELDHTGTLASLSTVAKVNAARPVLFGGFIVRGTTPKKFLIRAVGPALGAMGVGGTLADPQLTLYRDAGAGIAARNDDWLSPMTSTAAADSTVIAAAAVACGAFALPVSGKDAAVLVELMPGAYTAQVTGKGTDAGLVLLEIYGVP